MRVLLIQSMQAAEDGITQIVQGKAAPAADPYSKAAARCVYAGIISILFFAWMI